jgi:phage gpG-like protein
MGVRRTGDWDKARAKLTTGMGPRLATALRQATGGQAFVKLAESTIERKGSSKALIDTGFLVNAITQKIMADKAFVGLLRGTVNKDGEDMVNIGAVMEYGATIKHPNGATIIIPARPFLHPVMDKYREQILQNYREAIRSAL